MFKSLCMLLCSWCYSGLKGSHLFLGGFKYTPSHWSENELYWLKSEFDLLKWHGIISLTLHELVNFCNLDQWRTILFYLQLKTNCKHRKYKNNSFCTYAKYLPCCSWDEIQWLLPRNKCDVKYVPLLQENSSASLFPLHYERLYRANVLSEPYRLHLHLVWASWQTHCCFKGHEYWT